MLWPSFFVCLALCLGGRCAEFPPSPPAARLARWIGAQQCLNSNLPSFGAVRDSPEAAAIGPDGKPYCCICPYDANLAVLGLLRAKTPACSRVADLWIGWYFAHLNPRSAPDGVPGNQFCRLNGAGETNCVKPGDPHLCCYNDATDSAAATFFSVLWAAHQAGTPAGALASPEQKQQVITLAGVLLKLQQADGLCWAKADYRVKYLEDNSEVFAGLSDLAELEQEVFHDSLRASSYRAAAKRVQRGILSEMYDLQAGLFRIAKFEDGKRPEPNLEKWYPDSQAQLWPLLFGVTAANDPTTRAVISAINGHWNGRLKPDWASNPGQVNQGWLEAGNAYAMMLGGEVQKARSFVQAAQRLKFRNQAEFAGPFNVADAGWWLQILTKLPAEIMPNR